MNKKACMFILMTVGGLALTACASQHGVTEETAVAEKETVVILQTPAAVSGNTQVSGVSSTVGSVTAKTDNISIKTDFASATYRTASDEGSSSSRPEQKTLTPQPTSVSPDNDEFL